MCYVTVIEALTETGACSAKNLREINRCRIYLRVFYISDISTFNGQEITAWARKARRKEEVDLGMTSSTTANLLEIMETGNSNTYHKMVVLCYN
jgi:hypothetical protein